jgi:hypothetical protein
MKTISVLFVMFVMLGIYADAQDAKVIAEIAATSASSTVKGSPFSADAVSESVQTLADGNRIVRSSTSKLYRNSEGRFRREMSGGTPGFGSLYTMGSNITLLDPVGGFRYSIDPNLRTTHQMVLRQSNNIRIINGTGKSLEGVIAPSKVNGEIAIATGSGSSQDAPAVADKVKEEIRAVVTARAAAAPVAVPGVPMVAEAPMGLGMTYTMGSNSKWDTRTEQLGVQNIEGVDAEGTRTITTIPAGAIGNERPIEIVYEKWFSKDLQLVVMSKHNDPRYGEQTYRLTNIVRSEPDPSLFTLPQGYRLVTDQGNGYTFTTAAKAAQAEKSAAAAKAGQTVTTTYVKNKP